jgi:hypothetical protein
VAAEATAAAPERSAGPLRRAARVGRTLVAMHVEVAAREAARDRSRILGGVVFLVAGAVLFALLAVMLHVAGTFFLHERYGRSWTECALVVAGADLVVGLLLLLVGRGRLRGPLMPETRGMVRRTVDALTED